MKVNKIFYNRRYITVSKKDSIEYEKLGVNRYLRSN